MYVDNIMKKIWVFWLWILIIIMKDKISKTGFVYSKQNICN